MGRTRAFDETSALDSAVDCFWVHGFAGTSVRMLCEAMNIGSGSFYTAFSDKETCFRLALSRYLSTQGIPTTPCLEAVEHWFSAICSESRRHKGCLLVGAAGQLEALDPANRELVRVSLQRMEDYLWQCLAARPNARAEASMLAAAILGIHMMGFAGLPREAQVRSAEATLRSVGLAFHGQNVPNSGTIDT